MATPALQSLAKKHGVSGAKAESDWKRAKAIAAKSGQRGNYRYIMGITKKMMGENSVGSLWDILDKNAIMECDCDSNAGTGPENTDENRRRKVERIDKRRRTDESMGDDEIHTVQFGPLFGQHKDFAHALQGMNGAHRVLDSTPAGVVVQTSDPDALYKDSARLANYYGVQHIVAPGDQPSGGEGYPPPEDPQIVPGVPNGQARFFQKHMPQPGAPRITDVDSSTLDDNLFNAKNMDRSVPNGDDTHGHTPTGQDSKVYEAVLARIFREETTGSEQGVLKTYGITKTPHLSYAMSLVNSGRSYAEAAAETIRKFNLGG